MALDAGDRVWKRTYPAGALPAGSYEYKAAIAKSWDENYGAGGARGGDNIAYTASGDAVSFYYEHERHFVTSSAQGPIITAPGSMQDELGCAADWDPACMAPWLIDPDGDGVYTWSSTRLPVGNYEMKVAHGLSWSENYGEGGAPGGANVGFSVPKAGVSITISYTLATHAISVTTSSGGVAPDLKAAKAHWLAPDLFAWPASGVDPATHTWRLHWAPEAGLAVAPGGVSGGSEARVTYDPAGLPADVRAKFPHLAGYVALRLDAATAARAGEVLRGQFAVGEYGSDGELYDATGVQIPGVLDALYPNAATATIGLSMAERPTLRLWAPTAKNVALLLWPAGGAGEPVRVAMTRAADGTWSATGGADWLNREYRYEVTVFAPSTGKIETNLVTDPYSVALTLNSQRSVIVDLADAAWAPAVWRSATPPVVNRPVDQTIYELHIRDYSMSDPEVPEALRGSYAAFAVNGVARRHLEALADAGLNTVHLLPSFDIASIEEAEQRRTKPECDLASYPPDSPEQQACVMAQADTDAFNWGYDPWHFFAPEGSYASSDAAADGGRRVAEFRTMVGSLHDMGLRVVLDQVFNHTAASGQNTRSVLDRVVPGYYHRLNSVGAVEKSTCCENVATEHAMAQKLMVDSVVMWARDYRVDGFRFDLMGHHSVENMKALRAGLDQLTMSRDGVDGRNVTLYGEGWDFGEVSGNARFTQAKQGALAGTHIGTFNDRLRDGVRGGSPFDSDPRVDKGFATGGASANDTDLVQLGLVGNLRDFSFTSQESGARATGADIDYNGSPAGYAQAPDEVVNCVDAHDNETLFDELTLKLPREVSMADRVRLNGVALSTSTLSQGIPFWHAGSELLRSKSLDRNSYNSGDWFNRLDYTMTDNGFGRGLPPAPDNKQKWPIMQPLLADPALRPATADIKLASAMASDLLRLRASTKLFRLGSSALVNEKVSFPVSGTEQGDPQVIVMRINDEAGSDIDPALKNLLVVSNASGSDVNQQVPGLAGRTLSLHPVQANGADAVVKTASWRSGTGVAHVPAHTVAVFVEGQDAAPGPSASPQPSASSSATPSGPGTRPKPGLPDTGA